MAIAPVKEGFATFRECTPGHRSRQLFNYGRDNFSAGPTMESDGTTITRQYHNTSTTTATTTTQNDVAELGGSVAQAGIVSTIGYRVDQIGDWPGAANQMILSADGNGNFASGNQIIERSNDIDIFRVEPSAKDLFTVSVDVAPYAGNLQAKLTVFGSDGMTVFLGPLTLSDTLSASGILVLLAGFGPYYIKVQGAGAAGDVGQYTLTVTHNLVSRMWRADNLMGTPTNTADDQHVFSSGYGEFAAWMSWGYTDETTGKVGWGVFNQRLYGSTGLYRMYNPNNSQHYFTASPSEALILVGAGWYYENNSGYMLKSNVGRPWAKEIRMAYKFSDGDHLYTTETTDPDVQVVGGSQSQQIDPVTGLPFWQWQTSLNSNGSTVYGVRFNADGTLDI